MKLSGLYWNLRLFFMTFVGFLMSVMLVLLLSPMLLVFWVIAKIMYLIIKIKLGNKFIRPGGLDIIQGMESYQSRPYINAIGRFKGKVDIHKYRKKFMHLLKDLKDKDGNPRYRKFTQVFEKVYGYHVFKDDQNFDITNHIKKIELSELFPEKFTDKSNLTANSESPANANGSLNINGFQTVELCPPGSVGNEKVDSGKLPFVEWEFVLERLMGKYGCSPVKQGHPQWEMLLVEEDEHYTMVFKMHHSFSDGINFMRFYLEHLGDLPVKCNLPYNYHQPKWTRKILDCFWAFCLLPFGLSRLSFSYEKNPFHGPELSGDKMYLISKPICLESLKKIKRDSKTSMNGIFFTCMSNAIASHFIKKKSKVENVVVLLPVSLQDLSRPIKLENRFGLKGVLLPTFLDKSKPSANEKTLSTALRRLEEVQASCDRTKKDPSFLAIHWMLVFICSLLPSSILDVMFSTKGLTTSMSNIAGPTKEDFYILGCKKTDFCFFIPDRNPLGMGVSVAGFGDKVRIGLMIDRVFMETEEEGYEFLESFRQEVENLSNELQTKKNAGEYGNEEYHSLMIKNIP